MHPMKKSFSPNPTLNWIKFSTLPSKMIHNAPIAAIITVIQTFIDITRFEKIRSNKPASNGVSVNTTAIEVELAVFNPSNIVIK